MKLSHSMKIMVGLATLWVMVYPLLFMAVWLIMVVGMGFIPAFFGTGAPEMGQPPAGFLLLFFGIFPLHFITIFLQMALMTFYLVHVIKNKTTNETVRVILGVGVFIMPYIAMPIYYFTCVWRDDPPDWARLPDSPPDAPEK